jgi:hypothetical protein
VLSLIETAAPDTRTGSESCEGTVLESLTENELFASVIRPSTTRMDSDPERVGLKGSIQVYRVKTASIARIDLNPIFGMGRNFKYHLTHKSGTDDKINFLNRIMLLLQIILKINYRISY